MKTLFTKLVVTIALSFCLPMIGFASIFGTGELQITDFLLTKAGGGAIVVGTDIVGVTTSDSFTLFANVNGFTDFNNTIAGTGVSPIDGMAAGSDGTGAFNSPANGFAIDNTFALPGTEPFAMADSMGTAGSILSGVDVGAFGGVQLNNIPSVSDSASGFASLLSISTGFVSLTDLSIEFSFGGMLDIILDNAIPAGILTGSGSYFVQISANLPQTGGNGLRVNGSLTNEYLFQPGELNSGLLTAGSDVTYSDGGSFDSFDDEIIVLQGAVFSLEIFQAVSVTASPIPEPTAFVVWGVLGSFIATIRRRTAK